MTKHRTDLVYGSALPQDFLDTIQEMLGTYISPNATVNVLSDTIVQIPAGSDNDQVTLAINGHWRYNTLAANATHPGGAAGTYTLWATGTANSFTVGPPEVDSTNYAFSLAITGGSAPATPLFRQIGYVEWDGSRITDAGLLMDDSAARGTLEPGDLVWSASASRRGALLCDGSSYLRTTYPALFNALGGTGSPYGFADGTHFNVPDFRSRMLVAAGTGAGLSARAIGGTGGAESVTLTSNQSGVPSHTHSASTGVDSPDHAHSFSADQNVFSSLMGAGPTPAFATDVAAGSTGGASARHTHAVTVNSNSVQNASASHENMPPYGVGYLFIKT